MKRRALDTHALGRGGGTVGDQGGPNIAGTNGPGGQLIAGDHKFRDRPTSKFVVSASLIRLRLSTLCINKVSLQRPLISIKST